jgi:hypothetical protein
MTTQDKRNCFGETGAIQRNPDNRGKGVPTFGHLTTVAEQYYCHATNPNCASQQGLSTGLYANYDGKADGDPLVPSYPPVYQTNVSGQLFSQVVPFWLTPHIRDDLPYDLTYYWSWVDRVKRAGDAFDSDTFDDMIGYYNNVNTSGLGYSTMIYYAPGLVQMWMAYRDCYEDDSCTGMNP